MSQEKKSNTQAPFLATETEPVLTVISGKSAGKKVKVSSPVTIGRADDCTLRLSDSKVSRHHLEVKPADGGLIARDTGSKNGTFLNGRRITGEQSLKHGDILRLGETFLSVQFPTRKTHERFGSHWLITVSTAAETHFDEISIPEKLGRENLATDDVRVFLEVLTLAYETPEHGASLRRVTQRLVKLFYADSAILCLAHHNDYEPAIIFAEEETLPFLSEILKSALLQRKGILINDALKHVPDSNVDDIIKHLPRSQMCVPFICRGEIVGLFAIGAHNASAFTKPSLNLLTVLANQLAPVIANASRGDILERIHCVVRERFTRPLLGQSEPICKLRHLIEQVARQPISILITGETGSGKEVVARRLHQKGLRPDGPFVPVNCASIPADLFEAELFGHEKGAFTGAHRRKPGKLELAQDGTLFFDEIGELPLALQAKFLRVLETHEFMRLGGTKTIYTNAHILFAINRDLTTLVNEGQFREDLFFRINTFELHVPPLREHLEDIPEIAEYFLEDIQRQLGRGHPFRLSPAVLGSFLAYHWPGNVRELHNVLEQMAILSSEPLLDEDLLPERVRTNAPSPTEGALKRTKGGLLSSITRKTEKQIILQALEEAKGQKKLTAKILGISRPTLDKKLRLFGISPHRS